MESEYLIRVCVSRRCPGNICRSTCRLTCLLEMWVWEPEMSLRWQGKRVGGTRQDPGNRVLTLDFFSGERQKGGEIREHRLQTCNSQHSREIPKPRNPQESHVELLFLPFPVRCFKSGGRYFSYRILQLKTSKETFTFLTFVFLILEAIKMGIGVK